jgi:hypothetical protein
MLVVRSGRPGEAERDFLGHARNLEMPVGRVGIARLPGRNVLRARSPACEARGGRPSQQQGRAEGALDRSLHLRPHRIDDVPQAPDPGRSRVDRFEIVPDRLFARNIGQRAEDRREEAGRLRAAAAVSLMLSMPGLGSI